MTIILLGPATIPTQASRRRKESNTPSVGKNDKKPAHYDTKTRVGCFYDEEGLPHCGISTLTKVYTKYSN